MSGDGTYLRLEAVFADVFDRPVALAADTVLADLDGWDSLLHITLFAAVEAEFGVRFTMKDAVVIRTAGALATRIAELGG